VTRDVGRGNRRDAGSGTELQRRATRHEPRNSIVAVVVLH
jgi:hypothetical protein